MGFTIGINSPAGRAEIKELVYGRSYAHRVKALNEHGESSWSDPYTTTADKYTTPNGGHQEDHTVKYLTGWVPSAWTHVPPDDSRTPSQFMSEAISEGVDAWNAAVRNHANLQVTDLRICSSNCPAGANHDLQTVTVRMASLETDQTSSGYDHDSPDKGCGRAIACVKGQYANRHIEGSTIVIEAPAFHWDRRVYWTLDSDREGDFVFDDKNRVIGRHRYLIGTMTHELGHALGLADFHKHDELENFVAVMNNDPNKYSLTITAADLKQLWKIYRGHPKAPH